MPRSPALCGGARTKIGPAGPRIRRPCQFVHFSSPFRGPRQWRKRNRVKGKAGVSGGAAVNRWPRRFPLAPARRRAYLTRMADAPFWKTKSLAEMTDASGKSLCDGCGRCCLVKLEDEDDGKIHFTDIGCRLLDGDTCRCRDYENRTARVDDCVRLTAENLAALNWLPPTCAYRLVADGRDLYWWHPLVSGDPESVHAAGVSVRARVRPTRTRCRRRSSPTTSWPGRANGRRGRSRRSARRAGNSPPPAVAGTRGRAQLKESRRTPFFSGTPRGPPRWVCRAATPVPPVPDAALISAPARHSSRSLVGAASFLGASAPSKTFGTAPVSAALSARREIEQERAHAAPSDRRLECRRPGAGIPA